MLVVWTYYSAQIVLFGAEFVQVYANRYGSKIVPEKGKTVGEAATTEGAAHDRLLVHRVRVGR